jgi:hypothetical protein
MNIWMMEIDRADSVETQDIRFMKGMTRRKAEVLQNRERRITVANSSH